VKNGFVPPGWACPAATFRAGLRRFMLAAAANPSRAMQAFSKFMGFLKNISFNLILFVAWPSSHR